MYKDILRSIVGIEVFPLVSLLLFIGVFVAMLTWAGRLDAARLARLSRLPLDGDEPAPPTEARDAQGGAPNREGVTL